MAQIIFNIPDDKINRIKNAMAGLYNIPEINVGTEENPVYEPEFTKSQWAKESVRRFIRNSVARWEQYTLKRNIKFSPEDDIVT